MQYTETMFIELVQTLYPYKKITTICVVAGVGLGLYKWNDKRSYSTTEEFPPEPPKTNIDVFASEYKTRAKNAYVYSNIHRIPSLALTLGLSVDSLRGPQLDRDDVNSKLGAVWQPRARTTLRAAYFRTTKRPLALNQTLEPTQVAGFNQFFDDTNGAQAKRYGLALDQTLAPQVYGGVEVTQRKLETPILIVGRGRTEMEAQDETAHRAYLYWTPLKSVALSAEYFYENYLRTLIESSNDLAPKELTTQRIPVGVNFVGAHGWGAKLQATYVDQQLRFFSRAGQPEVHGSSDFWLLDTSVGYHFPKRRGQLSLGVKNLLDKKFKYQDVNFNSGEPLVPVFQPQRTLFVQGALFL